MAIEKDIIEAALRTGAEERVAPEALLAVALVETRARAFTRFDGRSEPLIRFEGHYFDRLLPDGKKAEARAAGLAHPRAGRIRNPVAQAARWAMLDRAAAIDAEAAYGSVSWGLCQVMGSHAHHLGYGNARDLAAEARGSIDGQFRLGARFLAQGHLDRRLIEGDVAGFSRRYNGAGFRRNRYNVKIAAALRQARAAVSEAGSIGCAIAKGARGAAVLRLQRALVDAGSAIRIDGIFGPRTEAALIAWQSAAGLAATGVADAATQVRLRL